MSACCQVKLLLMAVILGGKSLNIRKCANKHFLSKQAKKKYRLLSDTVRINVNLSKLRQVLLCTKVTHVHPLFSRKHNKFFSNSLLAMRYCSRNYYLHKCHLLAFLLVNMTHNGGLNEALFSIFSISSFYYFIYRSLMSSFWTALH